MASLGPGRILDVIACSAAPCAVTDPVSLADSSLGQGAGVSVSQAGSLMLVLLELLEALRLPLKDPSTQG